MTTYYQISNLQKIDISVVKGSSYRKRWKVIYNNVPFPFLDPQEALLWVITLEIREDEDDVATILSLDSVNNSANVTAFLEDGFTFYELYLTDVMTDAFSLGRKSYLVRLKRIADDWAFKLQKGNLQVIL